MNVWIEVLYIAAAIASILSLFYSIYAKEKGKRRAGIVVSLFFALTVAVLIFNRGNLAALLDTNGSSQPSRTPALQPSPSPQVPSKDSTATASADLSEVRGRLKDLQGRAVAMEERWQPAINRLKAMNEPLRADIVTSLGRVKLYTGEAQEAVNAGDAPRAKKNLDLAQKEMAFLGQQSPE